MKKPIILIPVLIILGISLLSSCSNNQFENSLTEKHLIGKVKTLEETKYKAVDKFGELQKEEVLVKFSYNFDKYGNLTDKNEYYPDGRLKLKSCFKYDKKNKVLEENKYNFDGGLSEKTVYNGS